jgi:hypothetical protein
MTAANSNRNLFLDDHDIDSIQNLSRTVNQPDWDPEASVLKPERPWEMGGVSQYGTVLYDKERSLFRMYYLTHAGSGGYEAKMVTMGGKQWLANRTLLGYATSKDGVHWERPNLGQVDFEGSTDNNMIDIGAINVEGAGIVDEPDDPDSSRRYKAIYWEHGSGDVVTREDGLVLWAAGGTDGMWVSFSPDGVHWSNYEGNPIGPSSDTSHYVVRDPATGVYRAYGRFAPRGGRVIGCMTSDDFINWNDGVLVVAPDDKEVAGPESDTQFYGMSVGLYEGLYLGGLWVYRPGTDGCIDTELAVSRDGLLWDRVADRQVFMPLGPKGGMSDGMVRTTANYIVRGDEIFIYYGLVNGPHSGPAHPGKQIVRSHPGAIGLARLRRDGWVSLNADAKGGSITTKPMTVSSETLHLNADATSGEIRASVVDDTGRAMPGFEGALTGDHLDGTMIWKSELPTQPMRLKLELRNAKVFSYWW